MIRETLKTILEIITLISFTATIAIWALALA